MNPINRTVKVKAVFHFQRKIAVNRIKTLKLV